MTGIQAHAVVVEFADGTRQTFDTVSISAGKLICRTPYGAVNVAAGSLAPADRAKYFPSSVPAATPAPTPAPAIVPPTPANPIAVDSAPGAAVTPAAVSSKNSANVPEPIFPKKCVGTPEFDTKGGRSRGGTAFLAQIETTQIGREPQNYIFTVRHLLPVDKSAPANGPLGAPGFVKSVDIQNLFGSGRSHFPVQELGIPVISDPSGSSKSVWARRDADASLGDLAIFKIGHVPEDGAATLAAAGPAVGDPLWVVAAVRGGVPKGELAHRMTVNSVEGGWLVGQFDNQNIQMTGASGAPVFNAAGKVVGVYSGHMTRSGKLCALIIPVGVISKVLAGAR